MKTRSGQTLDLVSCKQHEIEVRDQTGQCTRCLGILSTILTSLHEHSRVQIAVGITKDFVMQTTNGFIDLNFTGEMPAYRYEHSGLLRWFPETRFQRNLANVVNATANVAPVRRLGQTISILLTVHEPCMNFSTRRQHHHILDEFSM